MAASQDGLVYDPSVANPHGILEIKCPALARDASIKDLCSNFFLIYVDTNYKLKLNHNYYYQVQGQMHITKREWCDFVDWSPTDSFRLVIQRIEYDHKFWKEKMYPKLRLFIWAPCCQSLPLQGIASLRLSERHVILHLFLILSRS